MADFARILPLGADTDPVEERGWRLRLLRAEGETLASLVEEQVWPEKVADINAQHIRKVDNDVTLNSDGQVWLRDALTEMLGEIVDVEGLKHEVERLRREKAPINVFAQLENVIGPHCVHCGAEIDPDYCHCGERCDSHGRWSDPHAPVPMGCICGYDKPDLETLARSRGELLAAQRRALTHLMEQASKYTHAELAEMQRRELVQAQARLAMIRDWMAASSDVAGVPRAAARELLDLVDFRFPVTP